MSAILTPRQLVQQSSLTLVQQLLGALCALATTILMARTVGPAAQGLYNVAVSTALLVGLAINLGTPAATVYAVSRGSCAPRQAGRYNIAVAAGLGLLGAGCIGAAAAVGHRHLWPGVPTAVLVAAACLVPAVLANHLLAAVLQGAQAFGRYNAMALVAAVATFLGSAAALAAGFGVLGCVAAMAVGHTLATCWGAGQVRRLSDAAAASRAVPQLAAGAAANPTVHRRAAKATAYSTALRRAWAYFCGLLHYGILAAVANALAFASYRLDVFLLNAWVAKEAVGQYNVATSVAERLWMLSQAINMVLFAQVARREARRDAAAAAPVAANPTPLVVRHVLWAVAAAAAVLYACAGWVLPWVFGAPYAGAVAPLRALLPGVVCFNVARVIGQDFAGRGHVHLNVIVGALCLGLNAALNVLWIPRYGAVGAATASSVSYTVDSAVKLVLYSRMTQTAWTRIVLLQPADWQRLWPYFWPKGMR